MWRDDVVFFFCKPCRLLWSPDLQREARVVIAFSQILHPFSVVRVNALLHNTELVEEAAMQELTRLLWFARGQNSYSLCIRNDMKPGTRNFLFKQICSANLK